VRPFAVIADRFEIESEVGSGGMGIVYRARDLQSGLPVALKVLRLANADDASRFSREASLLAKISHPGIVHYLGHGVTGDDEHYLAMEWLSGGTLAERLATRGLTIRESIKTLGLVADALSAVHQHGIVHRDITPRNLIFKQQGSALIKVVDFGIARHGENVDLTKTGIVIGSPGYMAPEQARGERVLDPRADIFSIGCILYQCLTGRPPFVGDPLAVRMKVLMGDPLGIRELNSEISARLEDLVRRMLAKDPALRPIGAAAVADELGQLAESDSPTCRPSAPQFHTAVTAVLPGTNGGEHEPNKHEPASYQFLILIGCTPEARANGPLPDSVVASVAAGHGARMERIGEFARVVKFEVSSPVAGARIESLMLLARKLRARSRNAPMALVAGPASVTVHEGTLDRAATLLTREAVDVLFADLASDRPRGLLIRLDETARGLLRACPEVMETESGHYLKVSSLDEG
jgi:serine/threonine protein kinase